MSFVLINATCFRVIVPFGSNVTLTLILYLFNDIDHNLFAAFLNNNLDYLNELRKFLPSKEITHDNFHKVLYVAHYLLSAEAQVVVQSIQTKIESRKQRKQ